MEKSNKTPSHHEVENIAREKAIEFQPSIKRWLNKTSQATQTAKTAGSLGACITNTLGAENVNNETTCFENKVRNMNIEYNNKIKNFKKSDEVFKIVTMNVNSLQSFTKKRKIWSVIKSDPDIILMTDTRVKEYELANFSGNKRSVFSTDTEQRGVAIIIKKCFEPENFETDNETGNLIAITFKLAGKTHGLVGLYGPSEDTPTFFGDRLDGIIKKLKDAGSQEILIAGDMNIQLGKKIGYTTLNSRKKNALLKTCEKYNLSDHVNELAITTNTNPISFWRRNTDERATRLNEKYQASRLDHILTSYPTENINTSYSRFYPSDHAMTITSIKIKSRSGQTPWRLNRAAIDDEIIQHKIKKMANKLTKNLRKSESKLILSTLDDHDQAKIILRIAMNKWATLINFTKKITSKWARAEAEKRNIENLKLTQCMENLDLDNGTYNDLSEEYDRYEIEKYKLKTELYKFKNKFENKNLLKYKAQLNVSNRTMKKIKIDETAYEDDKEIRMALTGHFTSIFSCYCESNANRCIRCTRGDQEFVKKINPQKTSEKKLSNNQKKDLEKDVDETEIDKYVRLKLKKEGKAPGPDGIPYAFIYKFWPTLKKLISKIVMLTLNHKIMPKSLPEGLVIFLPKPGKNPKNINAWRPLTMLNSVYKICSGLVANRLDKIMEQIIHKHQYGFVRKRQAADVIEMLNKMINENDDKLIAIVGMDFRGAFDTVKHEAIIRALKMKNFGPKFISMVATLLTDNKSTISVNGRIDPSLEKVKVKRSARQGDPLSPFLFILVLDELLEMINSDENLTGLDLANEKIKGLAFADDNYTVLQSNTTNTTTDQVKKLMKIMKKFKTISGLDINVSKSEILTNNDDFQTREVEIKGITIKTTIKSLGVAIGRNVNLGETIKNKLKSAMESWNKRKLNYIEKIDVVNFILIPKIVHIIRHCKMDMNLIKECKKLVKNFVFGSNKRVGKDEVIYSNVKDGGWGLRSIEVIWAQLLMRWTLRALKMEDSLIVKSFREYIDANFHLDPKDPESSGHGPSIKKNEIYNSENLWENSYKILGWIVQKQLKEKICFNHQPLLHNKLITKQGKMINENDIPEIDFGPVHSVEALKENRIEIFGGQDENNKRLTRRIFLNFNTKAPEQLPPCEDDCRPPMRVLMSSRKSANAITRSCFLGNKIDTGEKAAAAMAAYTGLEMDQRNFGNHLTASNPRKNFLLSDRCVLLKLKIRFKIFYTKLDLYRMKIESVNDPNCAHCEGLNDTPQVESLRHILLECKTMQQVWKHFRKEINSAWRARYSFLEMLNGPQNRETGKLKSEYVFLRIMNRFMGVRNGEGLDAEIKNKLIKTCDDSIRIVNKIFDKRLKVSLGDSQN